jgi:hypothetical protein
MASVPGLLSTASAKARSSRLERPGWAAGTRFRSHGLNVAVRVNHPDLLPLVLERLPPGHRPTVSPHVDHVFSLWAKRGGAARVYGGRSRCAGASGLEEALGVLEREIRQTIATQAPRRTFLHAGVVAHRGRAILLPGRSRSGKTTLVAALLRAGATYLSDEYAVLDARGRAHPFAKPLSVRGPAGCDRHARPLHARSLGARVASRSVPVALVALLSYRPGGAWEASSVTPGRAVVEMLRHAAAARERPAEVLAALDAATAGAGLVAGERGEADEAARMLLRLLDRKEPSAAQTVRR